MSGNEENVFNKSSQTPNGITNETTQTDTIKDIINQNGTQSGANDEPVATMNRTPTPSVKSNIYSQKSTASAQSSNDSRSLLEEQIMEPVAKDIVGDGAERTSADLQQPKTPKDEKEDSSETVIVSTPSETFEVTVKETAETIGGGEVTSESPLKTNWRSQEAEEALTLEDLVDAAVHAEILQATKDDMETGKPQPILERNGSLASLQSKTESIKTLLDESPPILSRTQSTKSLPIEEEIEDNTSFKVVDEEDGNEMSNQSKTEHKQQEANTNESAAETEAEETENLNNLPYCSKPNSASNLSRPSTTRSRSPTIEEIKALSRRNSLMKSMESIYNRPLSKQYDLDNATETSSQSSAQMNSSSSLVFNATPPHLLPVKLQHTPLKQKSKTTHFLKSHRRVSPVKQSIKMVQAELYPSTLQRFEKPREAILRTFDQLDSGNWEIIMVGLKNMVRLMRYHPENLDNQMHMVCIQLTKSVRNLRSQVARAACQAATEFFGLKSRFLEQECDDLVCALLHRTADTNRFLRADATRALESMCDQLTPQKVLNIVANKGAQHQHALVRTTSAKLLNRLVERLGYERVYTMPRDQRDKFFITGANLLMEGSLETRSYAKSLFKLLSEHPNYQRLLLEVIPQRTYRNVEKTLKTIR